MAKRAAPKPGAKPACAREPQPATRAQRLLIELMLVGSICAVVLAIVGVCAVLSAVLSLTPIPVLVLLGAGIGLAVYARGK